jgi:hypothetical protein
MLVLIVLIIVIPWEALAYYYNRFGFTVCSSEKVDMHERYATFTIASIPYPGNYLPNVMFINQNLILLQT